MTSPELDRLLETAEDVGRLRDVKRRAEALNEIILLFGASYILFDGGASLRSAGSSRSCCWPPLPPRGPTRSTGRT